jgi:hypothetical protein
MQLNQVINQAVSTLSSLESKRKVLGGKLKELKHVSLSPDYSNVFENKLVFPIVPLEVNATVGGVDSGFVGKNMYVMDLVLVRSVGVVFEYTHNKVDKAHYLPSFFSFPLPHLSNHALELDELSCSKGLVRLKEEVKTAIDIIEKHSPDYCFLDGSIIPQYADKPRQDSKISGQYHSVIDTFQTMFAKAKENGCTIIACVEDSRGSRFRTILQKSVLKNNPIMNEDFLEDTFDAVLLDYFLEQGERSMAFSYSSETKAHPILSDFSEEWKNSVFACYLKPASLDRPLRIEFLHDQKKNLTEEVDRIAQVVFQLSNMHREYAYPSVLIEADLHARLKPDEVDIVYSKIMDKLGHKYQMKLRRDSRPF